MKNYLSLVLTLALFSGLAMPTHADEVVATVNGKKIMQSDLDIYVKYRQAVMQKPITDKRPVLDELINREIMYQEALKHKLDKDKELNYLVKQQKYDTYINRVLQDTDVAKPIPKEEIQKLYDEKIKNVDLKEFKVRHILLKNSEADAKTVIAELDKGKKFEDLAKEKSEGPSAQSGGDIGWLNAAQLSNMPSFAQALSEMKKDSYTKTPVKTQFGWHVIKLEDTRKVEPPPIDKVEKQLSGAIRQQRLQDYVLSLRKKAKIDIKMK